MKLSTKILAGVIPGVFLLIFLPTLLIFWCRRRRQLFPRAGSPEFAASVAKQRRSHSVRSSIAKLHRSIKPTGTKGGLLFHHLDPNHRQHHPHHQQSGDGDDQVSAEGFAAFDWHDHPELVAEAVENGWSRFTFAARASAFATRSTPLWGLCAACDAGTGQEEVETDWEIPLGSLEFMQTVRLNPTVRKRSSTADSHGDDSICSAKMCLPLPGPPLGASSFPQEAYFEITIVYINSNPQPRFAGKRSKGAATGFRKVEESSGESRLDSPGSITIDIGTPIQESRTTKEEEGKQSDLLISLGLTVGGSLPSRSFAGGYEGSIGFYSNGCVYLDGMMLVGESEKTEWAEVNRVIGCGYDPSKKKVFFTVDSQLMHAIHCNSDMYKAPLYPFLASNSEVIMLVNLGQSRFRYGPANASRTPNPCFLRTSSIDSYAGASGALDSRDLFSMGRINSGWLDNVGKRSHSQSQSQSQSSSKPSNVSFRDTGNTMDLDVESDLFEISLHT